MSLPDSMRAAVISRHGGPEVIELRRPPVPRPGPGEVLVRVAAAACNNTDLWTREGSYGLPERRAGWKGPVDFPRVQGADVAGTVAALGVDAPEGLAGARVLVDPAHYDRPGPAGLVDEVLGSERDGGFAEFVAVPVESAHPVDGSPLEDAELASLPIAYGTAMGMLERGAVADGHTVVVTGASGGVGLAAVQLAAARGARVVAVCSAAKADAVRAAGADAVVDRGRGTVVDDLADLAAGGVDVVVDVVAGPTLAAGLRLLRPGGRWVVAGALDGYAVELDVRRLYLANASLVGSTMHTRAHFEELVAMARQGEIRPVVAATYPLEELAEAQRQLATRRHVGKLVVLP